MTQISPSMTSPYMSPERDASIFRIRPLKAWRHFRQLVADKEDTTQVFKIIQCLDGRAILTDMENFAASEKGQKRIAERRHLPPLLDDHDSLRKLPEDSVGRAYVEFMESQGLTAQGLVDEYLRFDPTSDDYGDLIQWYANRRRDTHDLFHVLTGYSRDALGEASVLGFSYGQSKGLGIWFIAYAAGWEVKKQSPKGAPVMSAIRQGQKHGTLAGRIIQDDIMALLAEPLEVARARLGISPPTKYELVHKMMVENGIDPYSVIGSGEMAAA